MRKCEDCYYARPYDDDTVICSYLDDILEFRETSYGPVLTKHGLALAKVFSEENNFSGEAYVLKKEGQIHIGVNKDGKCGKYEDK